MKNVPSRPMRFRAKVVMVIAFCLLFGYVAMSFFRISVLENNRYQTMANDMHFGSIPISAHRGSIFDSQGAALARSATVYKVFIDPKKFREDMESLQKAIDEQNEDKRNGTYQPEFDNEGNQTDILPVSAEAFRQAAVTMLSEKLGITAEDVAEAMNANNQYKVLQEQVEKPAADEVIKYFRQYKLGCIGVEEDTKRYYPHEDLAAAVIGFTTGDGNGAYGVEASYDEYLSGVDGKIISAKDSNGNELPYKNSKTYPAQNGNDVYLTIDSTIQLYLEKHVQEMVDTFQVKNRGCAILMNVKTGAILGMATCGGFNLNDPFEIYDPNEKMRIATLQGDEAKTAKSEAREAQWKNKCITEIYEPGSVFKVITSASAIEENLIDLEHDSFYCGGQMMLDGHPDPIKCHNTFGHSAQTFYEALTNSCNPAFMQIGAKLGVDKFFYYFEGFGLTDKTGIDLPGECSGIYYEPENMSNVDLAVCSFGQGNTLTPLQMINSYCAAINGGYVLQPFVVDRVVDEDGNVVKKNERTVRRQVVSEETAAKMADALERVVNNSNGGNVYIKGYSIGGKSGTSQRLSLTSDKDEDQEYAASYVCFTPAYDPEIILLVMADMPNKDNAYYGSQVAVPTARNILTDVLPYMGFSPEYNEDEVQNLDVKVPLLSGSIENACATLDELGLNYEILGNGKEVVAQSPTTSTAISRYGTVYLFTEKSAIEYTDVPDFTGMDGSTAYATASEYGLNIVTVGASADRWDATVSKQSVEKLTKVQKGTVIKLEFLVNTNSD